MTRLEPLFHSPQVLCMSPREWQCFHSLSPSLGFWSIPSFLDSDCAPFWTGGFQKPRGPRLYTKYVVQPQRLKRPCIHIQCTEARRGTTSQADAQGGQGLSGVNIFVELRMVNAVWYRLYGTVHAQKVGNFGTEMEITESNSKGQCCRCQD